MCNIAQTVNVLQAMCLTEGDQLVLTPTYHVFDLYQSHQGGTALRTTVESPGVSFVVGDERRTMPGLSASASVRGGALTLSITNADATLPQEIELDLRGGGGELLQDASVHVLTHEDLTAHNAFDEPDALRPRRDDALLTERVLRLPPASVTVLTRPA
jgi:alpha-N-arabinofuranosidase